MLVLIFCAVLTGVLNAQGMGAGADAGPEQVREAKVYWVQDDGVVSGFRASPTATKRMVESLVKAATGQPEAIAAWASLCRPDQRVGIKVSTGGAPLLTTRLAVVASIIEGLKSAGVPGQNIIVWDRESEALRKAGFHEAALGCRVMGVDGNYLEEPVFFSARIGKLIWGDRDFRGARWSGLGDAEAEALSNKSHFAALLAGLDVIIHVPMMSDSAFTGIHGAIAGLALDSVDNWRRFGLPPAFGADDLPLIYSNELIGPKVALTIMDGLIAQYAGGPSPSPNYTVPHARLYASKDPVALDAVALAEIEAWRAEARLPPAANRAGHIQTAGELGLGVADTGRITTIKAVP